MQTRCPTCSAILAFTQQGALSEVTCPHCGSKMITSAPSADRPTIEPDWDAWLPSVPADAPHSHSPVPPVHSTSTSKPRTPVAPTTRAPTGIGPADRTGSQSTSGLRRLTLIGSLALAAVALVVIGIMVGGKLQQARQSDTGTIRCEGWTASVAPAGGEYRFPAPIPLDDIGQTIDHPATGSRFSISSFAVSPEAIKPGLDVLLRDRFGCELITSENILRHGLQGMKHTARDPTNGMVSYHELFAIDDQKLLLLTYVNANELEKAGLGKATYPSSTETMAIDRAEHFFESLRPVSIW